MKHSLVEIWDCNVTVTASAIIGNDLDYLFVGR